MSKDFFPFPEQTKADWLDQVRKELKGKPIEELTWQIAEDLEMEPFQTEEDLEILPEPILRTVEHNQWEVGESFVIDQSEETNSLIRLAIDGGVNSPRFIIHSLMKEQDWDILLQGVQIESIIFNLYFSIPEILLDTLSHFFSFLRSKSPEFQNSIIRVQLAGFNTMADADVNRISEELLEKKKEMSGLQITWIDGAAFYRGNEHVINELADILGTGRRWLAFFLSKHILPSDQKFSICFTFSLGTSYFLEIAKLRAFRILWANLSEALQAGNNISLLIDVVFAPSSLKENPNDNMIRASTQAMSAIIGGADRLTVSPSNPAGDAFSRRIARNVQHILKLESYFDRVVDPAAGSYYIETLTNRMASAGWKKFLEKYNA